MVCIFWNIMEIESYVCVLLHLFFSTYLNDFELVQVVCITSLFCLLVNSIPLYGHSTFWLSVHLLMDIWIVHYPHFKDEHTKAKNSNLAKRHTSSKWQYQDLEGNRALYHGWCTTQHRDLNTDLYPRGLALGFWAITNGATPSMLASPSADRFYYCQLPGLSYRAASMIDRTLNTMSLWNKRRKISIFREYLCIIFPFINLECEISDLAFLWALEVWSIKLFLVKSALILPSQGGMPLPWHKSVFHAICLSPLMEDQFILSHFTLDLVHFMYVNV